MAPEWKLLLLTLQTLPILLCHNAKAHEGEGRSFGGARVQCYTCDVDFSVDRYDANDSCLVGLGSKDTVSCSSNSNYCKVDVARLNGVLVAFSRKCSNVCAPSCSEKGFGINRETCTYCCRSNPSCGENRKQVAA
ncbi:uncharacterized protein LOC111260561 [Varroa jacobsoni]|uniref:uncharacterized protein LOC111260561 n=1 Tax=Varroa jacobsoni TaxID=62625 RepID=UPI000BFA98AE|nr:uncharacterized protein LOC111260561 [Varroa jacobsoni]XP_022689166.1 uncharacterized protein LOC111260561 [Varroa jacobsoni]XP_022689167.1 uncharacterized protein LOC111260561 [Varroa jacobsoni]XP_022689169.1 uncharacterized protein LOC111260561 [Varroa jacobsoni]